MAVIMLHRSPFLYAVTAGATLALHLVLCQPAAVLSGSPAIDPIYLIAVYLAPVGMLFPPFFDDFRNRFWTRLLASVLVAAGFSLIWAMVYTNLHSARPHVGYKEGVIGLIRSNPIYLIMKAIDYFPIALLFFFCLHGVACGLWSWVRGFQDRAAKPETLRDFA